MKLLAILFILKLYIQINISRNVNCQNYHKPHVKMTKLDFKIYASRGFFCNSNRDCGHNWNLQCLQCNVFRSIE